MKALLIKDFYLMIKTCKMFFIMILAFFAMGIFIPERSAIYLYAVIFIGMLSHSLLAIEERDGSDKYYLICPVSKKQIVAEKYVFSAIMVTVMITAIAVLEMIKNTNMSAILFILSLAIALGLIFPSISMPIMFRYGYAKGKILFMCLGGLLGICGAFFVNANTFFADTLGLVANGFLPLILIFVSVVIFVLSYLISVKLYQKREF